MMKFFSDFYKLFILNMAIVFVFELLQFPDSNIFYIFIGGLLTFFFPNLIFLVTIRAFHPNNYIFKKNQFVVIESFFLYFLNFFAKNVINKLPESIKFNVNNGLVTKNIFFKNPMPHIYPFILMYFLVIIPIVILFDKKNKNYGI